MRDIQNMTKTEQVGAFRSSEPGAFKMLAHLFGVLKVLSYLSFFIVAYFAYVGEISWWWLAACFGATILFQHLAKSSIHAHLMKQGHSYSGIGGHNNSPPSNTMVEKDDLEEAYDIVSDFGAVMERCDWINKYYDETVLPHKKGKVRAALVRCHNSESNNERKEILKTGLLALTHFQNGIGDDPVATTPDLLSIRSMIAPSTVSLDEVMSDLERKRRDQSYELSEEERDRTIKLAHAVLRLEDQIDKDRVAELKAIADSEYQKYVSLLVD